MSDQFDLFGRAPYNGEPPSQKHSDTSRRAAAQIKYRVGDLHRLPMIGRGQRRFLAKTQHQARAILAKHIIEAAKHGGA